MYRRRRSPSYRRRSPSWRRRDRSDSRRRPRRSPRRRYDSPPKEEALIANLHGLTEEAATYRQMRELTAAAEAGAASARAEQLRQAKELYIGNLPPGTAIYGLIDRLNDVLVEMGATTMAGKPIVSGWLGGEGQFAFLQLRTAEECNNALSLNGYNLDGYQLKVGRPKGATGAIAYSTSSSGVHGAATQFSLDETGGLGTVILPPLDESTKIERLVLVGAPLHAETEVLERLIGGDLEYSQVVLEEAIGRKSVIFEYKDVRNQRLIANEFLAYDRDYQLAVVRVEEAVRAGFINLQDEKFTSWTKRASPTRLLWICNFTPTPVGHEADLVNEVYDTCSSFGTVLSSQIHIVDRENVAAGIALPDKDVHVVVIEFEKVQDAQKCKKYLRGPSVFFLSESAFEQKLFESFSPNEEPLPEISTERDPTIIREPPLVRNRKIISTQEAIIEANKGRKKLKLAPEDQEMID